MQPTAAAANKPEGVDAVDAVDLKNNWRGMGIWKKGGRQVRPMRPPPDFVLRFTLRDLYTGFILRQSLLPESSP